MTSENSAEHSEGSMGELSWVEIKAYLEHDDRVVLPLGAVEAHGRHLGLGTDYLEAQAIAEAVGRVTKIVVAPVLSYGMSFPLTGFPGTLSLMPETLTTVLIDLLRGLYRHGFRRVLVINGHGGNHSPIHNAITALDAELPGLRVKNFQWWMDKDVNQIVESKLGEQQGSHASAAETSFMMAICPQGVRLDRLTGADAPMKSSMLVESVDVFCELYPDGMIGLNPERANAEAGQAILARAIEVCVREIESW